MTSISAEDRKGTEAVSSTSVCDPVTRRELQITLAERAAVLVSGGLDALYCLPLEIL